MGIPWRRRRFSTLISRHPAGLLLARYKCCITTASFRVLCLLLFLCFLSNNKYSMTVRTAFTVVAVALVMLASIVADTSAAAAVVVEAVTARQAKQSAYEYNCTWSDPLILEEAEAAGGTTGSSLIMTLTLEHYRNPALSALTVRVALRTRSLQLDNDINNSEETTSSATPTRPAPPGWIGIGINLEGNDWMAPAVAVIGRRRETVTAGDVDVDVDVDVRWYEIRNDAKDGSGVSALFPDEHEDPDAGEQQQLLLQDASFQQDAELGSSTLEFTMPLELETNGRLPGLVSISDDSMWIYAAGDLLEDGSWGGGRHRVGGSLRMTLQDRCTTLATATATAANSNANSTSNSNSSNGEQGNDNDEGESEQGDGDGDGSLPPIPTSSVAVASSEGATINIHTAMRTVHMWLMVAAWGVLAPLAIGASLLRKLFPPASAIGGESSSKPMWYKSHLYLGAMCVALTAAGIVALAVVAAVSEPIQEPRDQRTLQHHRRIGYSVFVALLAHAAASAWQFGLSYVPPPPPPERTSDAQTDATVGTDESESSTAGSGVEDGEGERPTVRRERNSQGRSERDATGRDETDCLGTNPLMTRRVVRRETANQILVHRLAGGALLGLAWFACQTGYVLLGETPSSSWIFWTCASATSGSVLLAMAVQKERERPAGDY